MPSNVLLLGLGTPCPDDVRTVLEEFGIQLLQASSPAEALALLQHHNVMLAILALQAPDLDGKAAAAQIRATASHRDLPIMFVAESAQEAERVLAGDTTGAMDLLYKPVTPSLLRGKLQLFVDLHRQRRELAQRAEELERLSRLNALMIGALVHDIRTPLAVLTLNAELVVRRAEAGPVRQAGTRIKGATAILTRQVDHLINLATVPSADLRPRLERADMAQLARERLAEAAGQGMLSSEVSLQTDGDTSGEFDGALMSQAIDYLMLLAAMHGGGQPLQVQVDGRARHAMLLRITMPTVVDDDTRQHLFGGRDVQAGFPSARVGDGLHAADRIARAHGGSLIGRSQPGEGTLFELMLPRAVR